MIIPTSELLHTYNIWHKKVLFGVLALLKLKSKGDKKIILTLVFRDDLEFYKLFYEKPVRSCDSDVIFLNHINLLDTFFKCIYDPLMEQYLKGSEILISGLIEQCQRILSCKSKLYYQMAVFKIPCR